MKLRGTRECQSCGNRWSYYETGSVSCPDCGSMRSVGVEEERKLHTATDGSLDLTPVREAVDSVPLREVAERAMEETRRFTRSYGFIDGGVLQPLDDGYLAAMELRTVADTVGRAARVDAGEEQYFLRLLQLADADERPAADEVPASLHEARGLAYALAVGEYREELRTYLDEHPDATASDAVGRLRGHVKRARALDGDISIDTAETLVRIARDIASYLLDKDETALVRAEDRLDGLA